MMLIQNAMFAAGIATIIQATPQTIFAQNDVAILFCTVNYSEPCSSPKHGSETMKKMKGR